MLARLEAEKIAPSPPASPATLLRRLSLDLSGLPPSTDEAAAFARDATPKTYAAAVERLLASPHFGERFGKHWLDLARYSDTDGYSGERYREHAWRFRDWVIDAVNSDLPFDRFTMAQLAGDLLPGGAAENVIAAGFHRHTLTNRETGTDQEEFRVRQVVDRVNTTGTAWLGLTLGCAHCHSHKYDPISQTEYFGLYAFFNNLTEVDLEIGSGAKAQTLAELDGTARRDTRVHVRGDFLRAGEQVKPHTPAALSAFRPDEMAATRLDLARWLTDGRHPLTARVAVNRWWQALFGAGLVRTPEDFGKQGERPTHPHLLDWLATELVRSGWSRKHIVRLIVMSRAYRQASAPRADLLELDPGNRLLARQNRFRVEAETVRDLTFAAGSLLDRRVGGPSFRPAVPKGSGESVESYWPDTKTPDERRRGLYIAIQRTSPFPMLAAFDAPDSNIACARRLRSNTPLQALTLLNTPAFVECARTLGRRLDNTFTQTGSIGRTIRLACRICLAREPDPDELRRIESLWRALKNRFTGKEESLAQWVGDQLPGGATPTPETAAWIGVARVLLNTDEFVTRE